MEKVWIFWNDGFQRGFAVYSTKEKAQKALNDTIREMLEDGWDFQELTQDDYWIEEMAVE